MSSKTGADSMSAMSTGAFANRDCAHRPAPKMRGCRSSGQPRANRSRESVPATRSVVCACPTLVSAARRPASAFSSAKPSRESSSAGPTTSHSFGPSQYTRRSSPATKVFGLTGRAHSIAASAADRNARSCGSPRRLSCALNGDSTKLTAAPAWRHTRSPREIRPMSGLSRRGGSSILSRPLDVVENRLRDRRLNRASIHVHDPDRVTLAPTAVSDEGERY